MTLFGISIWHGNGAVRHREHRHRPKFIAMSYGDALVSVSFDLDGKVHVDIEDEDGARWSEGRWK